MRGQLLLLLLAALLPAVAGTGGSGEADPITGGEGPYRRLFLDALLIEDQAGLRRVFHSAEKHPQNPVLVADTPWEIGGSGPYLYGTVLRDQGRLRMWYHFVRGGYRNGYAESEDGIHWRKPVLGIVNIDGSSSNNVFVGVTQDPDENPPSKERGQCHNPSVIVRPEPEPPERRYALFCFGADYGHPRAAFSPDGLHWTFAPETAKRGLFQSSDVVNFFYDPYRKRYVATWKGATRRGRSAGIATSPDGLEWSKPADMPIFTADDLDPPNTQVYGMPVFPYQGLYIGLPWIYHAGVHYAPEMLMTRQEAEAGSPRAVDVQLAWSWDLINWTRTPGRGPFIRRGPQGAFDSAMIFTARAPVVIRDRLYFYYGGFDRPHDARQSHGAIGIATLRLDGFCSMHADRNPGWLITRREKLAVPRILINAVTEQDGEIRAEILDVEGEVIPGFSLAECVAFRGDSVAHALRWRTEQFPEAQKNSVKKIRFLLKSADLYSYLPLGPDQPM